MYWINGINLGATRPDLVDRGLIIEHTPIPKDKRRLRYQVIKIIKMMIVPLARNISIITCYSITIVIDHAAD